MNPIHKLFYGLVNESVLPKAKRRNEATALDLKVMEVLNKNMLLNLPTMIIKNMANATIHSKGKHGLSCRFLHT